MALRIEVEFPGLRCRGSQSFHNRDNTISSAVKEGITRHHEHHLSGEVVYADHRSIELRFVHIDAYGAFFGSSGPARFTIPDAPTQAVKNEQEGGRGHDELVTAQNLFSRQCSNTRSVGAASWGVHSIFCKKPGEGRLTRVERGGAIADM